MKLLVVLVAGAGLVLLGLPLMLIAVIATHPWLAVGALVGSVQVVDQRPPAVVGGVPPEQWPIMVDAAKRSSCGVTPEDLAAIAKTESDFGKHLLNPVSGAFGYGQFDAATWAAYGHGNPDNPVDALPAMARTLCARGYAANRTKALNSYGGCVTPLCLGDTDYATVIDNIAKTIKPILDVVKIAHDWIGTPYLFGGTSRAGVDCSGLIQQVYQSIGIKLPRVASDQFAATTRVAREDLLPGDLVFFANTYMPGISHVGIYIGDGQQINAPTEGERVAIAPVFTGFWGSHYAGGGRVKR